MLAWWLALWGCSATLEAPTVTGPTSWDTGTASCGTAVLSTGPTGAEVNRHRHVTIDLPPDSLLEAYDVDVAVERDTFRGWETVPGTSTVREGPIVRVEFVPDAPLAPLTDHAVVARTPDCDQLVAFAFTTSPIGLPVEDPVEALGHPFVGNAANASLSTGKPTTPELGPTGAVQFVIQDFDLGRGGISMTARREPLDIYQDVEDPVYLEGLWNNPSFELQGERFPLHLVDGRPVDLQQATLTGDLSPDRRQLAGLAVRGTLDLRTLGLGAATEDLCATLAQRGECVACGDGEPLCVVTEFRDWTAQRIDPR